MIKQFDEYIKAQKDTREYKISTLKLIDEYVNIFLTHIKEYNCCVDFYFTRDNKLIVSYLTKSGDSNTITFNIDTESYNKMKKFIDNPELYRDTNKYNL